MVDIQKLIDTILSDTKIVTSGNFASKVYKDEPILLTATQMERYTPSQYRAMRKMAKGTGIYYESDAKIFYEQGRFMEDFEDDFDYQGEFSRYYPTYQSMSDQQLRGYFSWRTKVRRGLIEKTSLSFVFVYIYELLNRIGVKSPEDGFHTLKNFWLAYKEIDQQIDRYVRLWLKDYVIYNNLDKSFLEEFSEANFDEALLILLNHRSYSAGEVFAALNSLSSYNLENSRFFKQQPEAVKNVVHTVFGLFSDHYLKNCQNTLFEKFFGQVYSSPYTMFHSAVFYRQQSPQDLVYEINSIYKYRCQNGTWSCERFFGYKAKSQKVGSLLKTIDFLMRRKYNFKSALKAGKTTKILEGIINQAIDDFGEKQRQAARLKIEIDVSKLQTIRAAALEIQNKLIVEESPESEMPEASKEETKPAGASPLNELEQQFMGRLLSGRAYDELLRSKGLMLSVMIDAVNEKLFELFNDTVITEDGDRAELIEDYIDELKELITE